jgi:SAM-dependent methyltransferase
MTKAFGRFLALGFAGSCLLPVVTTVASFLNDKKGVPLGGTALALAVAAGAILLFRRLLRRLEPWLDADAGHQAAFLDTLPLRYVDLAIAGAAGLSLFLELGVIRWQGTVFEFFAFYKNFGLLACFAGLGLGYALATRDRIPLVLVIPLLGWQFALLIGLRFGLQPSQLTSLSALPVLEQLNMGVATVNTFAQGFATYFLLAVVFLLTALAFVPIGQLCGRLMGRRPDLRAYGLNLLGSLGGVVLMFLVSSLWTPPVVWYAVSFAAILVLSVWRPSTLVPGLSAALGAVIILAWPVRTSEQRIYSPYQLLEIGYGTDGYMLIRAAGHYYQRVHDLSPARAGEDPERKRIREYYDFAYRLQATPADVAVVGAGTGNDVAAALRAGAARVDAIEIDPAILRAGAAHPEHPYEDRRAHAVVDDARSFLRTTDRSYDLIVYGLLDSHTLLSHASGLRLDSFVYTVESFREARARLKPGGLLVVSFSFMGIDLGRKMNEMLRQAFDGAQPVVVTAAYDGAIVFVQSKEANFALPAGILEGTGLRDVGPPPPPPLGSRVDVSTDDWPFFYMPRRVYPVSYLIMLGLVLLGSAVLTGNFIAERPRVSELSFFLLGAGFMLVETKAITELGLTFGNTWQVIGIVIGWILLMAFLANTAVRVLNVRRPHVAYVLLLGSLVGGWLLVGAGGLPATTAGRLATAAILTSPMFFSGIVFSTLLAGRGAVAAVMAANLLGAMVGGMVEYNSMYFGFRFLYLLAMAFYAAAFVFSLRSSRPGAAAPPAPAAG